MAIAGTVAWDVRTTGSDSNGGGFNVGASGTDYSQQDSAQVSYTDIVIGTTTTHLTSSANPFTSAHVGNIINIVSGTGFTVGRYQVVSVSAGTATMDRAVGTASSTGGTGSLGGALANVSTAVAAMGTTGNTVWLQAGTYTYAATTAWASNIRPNIYSVIGYETTHGDNGTPPLITTITNSVNLVGISGNNTWMYIQNINFSNTSGVPGFGVYSASGSNFPLFSITSCKFSGFSVAIGGSPATSFGGLILVACEVTGCTGSVAIQLSSVTTSLVIVGSNIHDNAGKGIVTVSNTVRQFLSHTLITGNLNQGFNAPSGAYVFFDNCTIANNGSDGINMGAANLLSISNCIIYGNAGFGVNVSSAGSILALLANAYGGNTSGNFNNLTAGTTDISLSADPFTDDTAGDFSLNSTSGGGASCKAAGYPGIFPGALSTGYLDIGAVQSGSGTPPPASGGGSYTFIA